METYPQDEYDKLINEIVNNIIDNLDKNIFLPMSFNCIYEIDTDTLRNDLYKYIYSKSLR